MSKIWLILFFVLLLVVGVGAIFLANWDIPAPAQQTEKTLPDDMFPK